MFEESGTSSWSYLWGKCIMFSVVGPSYEGENSYLSVARCVCLHSLRFLNCRMPECNKQWVEQSSPFTFPSEISHLTDWCPSPCLNSWKLSWTKLCGVLLPFQRHTVCLMADISHTSPKPNGGPSFHTGWRSGPVVSLVHRVCNTRKNMITASWLK